MNIQLNSNHWPIFKPQPNDDECYVRKMSRAIDAVLQMLFRPRYALLP